MTGKRVGGEADGYCTKCRMILAHTIIAMVGEKIARVQCNTCMGQHAHRPQMPGSAKPAVVKTSPAKRTTRATKAGAEALPFETIFEGADLSLAKKYSPRERFLEADILDHPTFGMGLIEGVRNDKVDVIFRTGRKTLIHGLPPKVDEAGIRTGS